MNGDSHNGHANGVANGDANGLGFHSEQISLDSQKERICAKAVNDYTKMTSYWYTIG